MTHLTAAAVAAAVTATAGFALSGGVVQQGLYSVGNTAARLCITHPTACARVGAGLTLWDKVEDIGLQAKLAIQTAQGNPRAAETALELQLERLDNAPGNTTFRETQESFAALLGRYQRDVSRIARKHGDDGVRFLQNVADVDLANVNLEQGYVVSRLAQELNIPITITGRWADTPAEKELREKAAKELDILLAQGVNIDLAKVQIGQKYGINPQQVKVSTGGPEVDVFIPKDIWDKLSPGQQDKITEELKVFNVNNDKDFTVDFYQNLSLEKIELGWPDPRINVPPGSITFTPDGAVTHEPFAFP